MYVSLTFNVGFSNKFEVPPSGGGTQDYTLAMRDGFAAGLAGFGEQILAALANELPNHDSSNVGVALAVQLNEEGVADVFIGIFPSFTEKPEPVFELGPQLNAMTCDPARERIRFRTSVLNVNPLPMLDVVTAMCRAEALELSQRIARDGVPVAVKRAIADVGKALRYLRLTALTDGNWHKY